MKVSSSALSLNVLLWLVPCIVLFVFAYSSSIQTVVTAWNGVEVEGSNHGWLVLACCFYLLWLRRDTLLNLPLQPSLLALVFLAGTALLWFLSKVTQIQAGQMGVLPLLILLGVGALLGPRHLLVALLPVGMLFFALPVWQPLLPVLQDITTAVTHFMLKLIGRPVYVVDNYVHVSGGSFIIEEACSGLRFLLVSTTLSLMNSALARHTLKQGASMLGLAILLSFIANWVRVVFVILLGDYTQMQHPWVNDHANLGWVIYLVLVLIPFFAISRYVPLSSAAAADASAPQAATSSGVPTGRRVIQVLAAVVLFMTPLGFKWLGAMTTENPSLPALPRQLGAWNAVPDNSASNAWQPAFLNTTGTWVQAYQRDGDVIRLHLAHYQTQEQGAELINANNHIVDDMEWQIQPASESTEQAAGDIALKVATVSANARSERVWYWYDVGGYATSNDYVAKIYQVLAFIRGRSDATLVAISASCVDACEQQDAALREFFAVLPSDVLASGSQH